MLPVWAAWVVGVVVLLAAGAALGIVDGAGGRPQGFLWPLFSWDYDLYRYVSVHGYIPGDTPAYAFFPLWPLVLAAGGWTLAAAVVVGASAAAFLGVAAATQNPRRTAIALAPLAAAAAVHGYFWWRDGEPGAFFRAQSHWGRDGIEPLLLVGVLVLAALLWRRRLPLYAIGVAAMAAAAGSLQTRVEALRLGLVALPALSLLRNRVWIAYSVAVLALSLGSGSIQSLGRQSLLAFPLIWAAAGRAPRWLLAAGAVANAALLLLLSEFAP